MKNVFSISHTSDIDGVGGAALVKRKFGIPTNRLFFAGYSRKDIEYIASELQKFDLTDCLVIISDIGSNKPMEESFLNIIDMVREKNGSVYWFDHHPWSEDAIKRVASKCEIAIVGENESYCGTEITRKELGFNDSFTKKFAEIVHYSDFNIKPKMADYYKAIGIYAMSITSYNITDSRASTYRNLRHLAEVISKGRLFDAKVVRDARKFEKLNESRIKKMVSDLFIGKRIALGFSQDIQSTAGCAAIHDNSNRDIAIYVNVRNGKGHIRSKKSDISRLANALGGGGHPHASGFQVPADLAKNLKTKAGRWKLFSYLEGKAAEA